MAGALKRLQPRDMVNDVGSLIRAGRVISAEHRDGKLLIEIPIYVAGESAYGATYCSSDVLPLLSPHEKEAENFTKVDNHWWAHEYWLGK